MKVTTAIKIIMSIIFHQTNYVIIMFIIILKRQL